MESSQLIKRWVGDNIWAVILILSIFIQITPIKLNPWSTILKWIGKILLKDVNNKMDNLTQKVEKIDQDVAENEKDRIRWEILDFANSCHNGRGHTRDEFLHIISLKDKYVQLLDKTHDVNGVFELEYEYIQELYAENLNKNSFLKGGK